MIIAFLTLLLLQYSLADNKECRRTFGKEYKALDIGLVDGACQYTKSCLKCMKGFRMHSDQYCEPKSPSQQARVAASMEGDQDPCQKQLGANYTSMYPGACMFKGCFLCLNGGEVGLGVDGLPACVLQADSKSKRRRRSVATDPSCPHCVYNSPLVVQQHSPRSPFTTAAPIEAPSTLSASAPLPPISYPRPSMYPQYPQSSYVPPYRYPNQPLPFGYPKKPLGGLFNDPMMLLLFSGGLGGDSFSKFLLLSQFGNLGGHGNGLPRFPPSLGYHGNQMY